MFAYVKNHAPLAFLAFILFFYVNNLSQAIPQQKSKQKRVVAQQSILTNTRGLILVFHKLPNSSQTKWILKVVNKKGLKRTHVLQDFRMWLFRWPKTLKSSKKAKRICKKLSKLKIIKLCLPDNQLQHKNFDVGPNPVTEEEPQGGSTGVKPRPVAQPINEDTIQPDDPLSSTEESTQGNFNPICIFCRNQSSPPSAIPANIKTCGIVTAQHNLMKGQLSDYWAQDLIGADLLKEELLKSSSSHKMPDVLIADNFDESHGWNVKNLMSGPHGVLPDRISLYQHISLKNMGFSSDFSILAEKLKSNPPDYINNSMAWFVADPDRSLEERSGEIAYDSFKKLIPPSIIVLAAGNKHPKPLDSWETKGSKDLGVIIAGSLSPSGFASSFSQSGEEITILAPSDKYITSANKDGGYEQFSGTSGATPLVTASLAGFDKLAGYHPTAQEAKLLLQNTSIPTINSFERPQTNGKGMLNSYKLGMVAKRIQKKCKNQNKKCYQDQIRNPANYRFPLDKSINKQLKQTFPECSSGQSKPKKDSFPNYESYATRSFEDMCDKKAALFKKLRQQVLLNPRNKQLWQTLSCIYRQGGFHKNAEGLDNFALATGGREEVMARVQSLLEDDLVDENEFRLVNDFFKDKKQQDTIWQKLAQNADTPQEISQMIESMLSMKLASPTTSVNVTPVINTLYDNLTALSDSDKGKLNPDSTDPEFAYQLKVYDLLNIIPDPITKTDDIKLLVKMHQDKNERIKNSVLNRLIGAAGFSLNYKPAVHKRDRDLTLQLLERAWEEGEESLTTSIVILAGYRKDNKDLDRLEKIIRSEDWHLYSNSLIKSSGNIAIDPDTPPEQKQRAVAILEHIASSDEHRDKTKAEKYLETLKNKQPDPDILRLSRTNPYQLNNHEQDQLWDFWNQE